MSLPVVILAGGKGTRLGELTANRPKALVEVAGKPFIHHQLDLLRESGHRRVIVLVSHLGRMIEHELRHINDMDISILYDWPPSLGTAAAIRASLANIPNSGEDAFFVLYGDSYLPCDYSKIGLFFLNAESPAMMVVCADETHPNVQYGGGYVIQYNKQRSNSYMHHIDYGLSAFRKRIVYRSYEEDLSDLFHRAADDRWLKGYEWPESYFSIGSPEGLKRTEAFILSRTAQATK